MLRARDEGPVTPYPVPVPDFALERVVVDGDPLTIGLSGPTMVLATAGEVTVTSSQGEALTLAVGTVAFADSAEEGITLTGAGEAFVAGPGR